MPVRAQCIPGKLFGLLVTAFAFSEGNKRSAVQPKCATIVVIPLEQFLQRFGVAALHQTSGKDITDTLVVVRVQPHNLPKMTDRFVYFTEGLEGGAHPAPRGL